MGRYSGKFILVVIALAMVLLVVWAWDPLSTWVITKEVPIVGYPYTEAVRGKPPPRIELRGVLRVERFTGKRVIRTLYWPNGYIARQQHYVDDHPVLGTHWYPEGRVFLQSRLGNRTRYPPWWGGVTDQTYPSAPDWVMNDKKWQKAIEEGESEAAKRRPRWSGRAGVGRRELRRA